MSVTQETNKTITTEKELMHRGDDGLDVRLMWHGDTENIEVLVNDTKTGESYKIPAPKDKAMDVFNHPFIYLNRE